MIKEGSFVIFLWGGNIPPSDLEDIVLSLKQDVGASGKVQVEHESILLRSAHSNSSFDIVMSGSQTSSFTLNDDVLAEILKILKPNGSFLLWQTEVNRSFDNLKSALILAGFANITQIGTNANNGAFQIICQKPNYEVGTRQPLSFAKKAANSDVAKVWTLSASDMNDDDIEIIDSDKLLGPDDLKRPNFSGIKTDCGTSKEGKRKACKGCTCGLKEELDNAPPPAVKSACGSCYLGDAFRCASCPYLGMPPFKPGEQIKLSDRQLNPDIQT